MVRASCRVLQTLVYPFKIKSIVEWMGKIQSYIISVMQINLNQQVP